MSKEVRPEGPSYIFKCSWGLTLSGLPRHVTLVESFGRVGILDPSAVVDTTGASQDTHENKHEGSTKSHS